MSRYYIYDSVRDEYAEFGKGKEILEALGKGLKKRVDLAKINGELGLLKGKRLKKAIGINSEIAAKTIGALGREAGGAVKGGAKRVADTAVAKGAWAGAKAGGKAVRNQITTAPLTAGASVIAGTVASKQLYNDYRDRNKLSSKLGRAETKLSDNVVEAGKAMNKYKDKARKLSSSLRGKLSKTNSTMQGTLTTANAKGREKLAKLKSKFRKVDQ
jgi:hypothetical protein